VSKRTTIVVGAGSGGGIVASRLSEDAQEHVILVEAGPDLGGTTDLPSQLADADSPSLVDYDWGQTAQFAETNGTAFVNNYPRGRLVGGSSAVNAAIAVRGLPQDYDEWAELGNDEWSWESVLPFFTKFERDEDFGDSPYHGDSGPIPINRDTTSEWSASVRAVATEFVARGLPEFEDSNAPDASGVGPLPRNRIGKFRASTAVTYVEQARHRENLDIVSDALVTRVLVEDLRAVGVEVDQDGVRRTIPADRVVLCAGTINTPQILMLSGIGPKASIEEVGLEVVLDLPGVGQNLQDHPGVPLIYGVKDPAETRFGFRTHVRYSSDVPGAATDDINAYPSVLHRSSLNFPVPPDVASVLMLAPQLAKPRGAGWLSLASADPSARPDVHLKFLDDELDMTRMLKAIPLFLDVIASEGVAPHIGEPLLAPSPEVAADESALREWILQTVLTSYHPTGTCRMGPDGDDLAVVDQHLKVRGIDGLYVGDASVMPVIPSGFTNLPCYMVGERLADWLRRS